jgi:hypothetical protein
MQQQRNTHKIAEGKKYAVADNVDGQKQINIRAAGQCGELSGEGTTKQRNLQENTAVE